ncbi:hypothetical protein PG614_08850 [Riemerella anatipestifer]|nr:hypothetical protein [Riemerella anatipestifer]MDY3533647.1 hypothetical protein [Riemerella anatipestifer]MDY3536052.1 hypothetical protein [Riemerella anatipestifer]
MKTTAARLMSVLAFLVLSLAAYGQDYSGKVGINTSQPNATLDIKSKSANSSNTLEGLVIPNVSKDKAYQMTTNTKTPLKESTLIYVDNLSDYSGADARVGDITEKGYYFWNGTKWVRSASSVGNEWTYAGRKNFISSTTGHEYQTDSIALTRSMPANTVLANTSLNKTLGVYSGNLGVANYNTNNEFHSSAVLGGDGALILNRGDNAGSNSVMGYIDYNYNNKGGYKIRTMGVDYRNATSNPDGITGAYRILSNYRDTSGNAISGGNFSLLLSNVSNTFGNANATIRTDKNGYYFNPIGIVKSDEVSNTVYSETFVRTGKDNSGNASKIRWSINKFMPGANWDVTTERLQRTVDASPMGFIDFGISGDTPNAAGGRDGLGFGYGKNVFAVIRENGNLGVGTLDPSTRIEAIGAIQSKSSGSHSSTAINPGSLEIFRDPNSTAISSPNTMGYLDFKRETSVDAHARIAAYVDTRDRKIISFSKSDTGNMVPGEVATPFYFDLTEGKLGVGISTPSEKLEVVGNVMATGEVRSTAANGFRIAYNNKGVIFRNDGDKFLLMTSADQNGLGTLSTDRPLVYEFTSKNLLLQRDGTDGNVGIGVLAPSEKLEVNGGIKSSSLAGQGNRTLYADANGVIKVGSTAYASASLWSDDVANNKVVLAANSNVTIDKTSGELLAGSFKGVNGATIFPDYVFQKYYTGTSSIKSDYSFKTLSQVEDFVKANGHLPGYQSAAEIKKQGYIDLMATQLTNVEKIEELYLHSIEQDKALKAKDAKIAELEARLQKLEALLVK